MKKDYPKTWEHKENKKRVRVMPWWECIDPIIDSATDEAAKKLADGKNIRIGALVQIGWLIENENGVWFGVNMTAQEYFSEVQDAPADRR